MPKRFTAPRSEAREFATTTPPPTAARDATSSTAIDINREPSDEPRDQREERYGPNEEDIRRRAYQLYLERGGVHGSDFDDWLEAERELRNGRSEVGS